MTPMLACDWFGWLLSSLSCWSGMNVAAQGMQTTQTCIPSGEQVMGGEPGRFLRKIYEEYVSRNGVENVLV